MIKIENLTKTFRTTEVETITGHRTKRIRMGTVKNGESLC